MTAKHVVSIFVVTKVCRLHFWYVVVSLAGTWDMVKGLRRVDFDKVALNHSALLQWWLTMRKGYMTRKPALAMLRCQRIETFQWDHVKRPHWCERQFGITAKLMDTDRCSNDKKLTSLETLNYITMCLHIAKEIIKVLMSNGKCRH